MSITENASKLKTGTLIEIRVFAGVAGERIAEVPFRQFWYHLSLSTENEILFILFLTFRFRIIKV